MSVFHSQVLKALYTPCIVPLSSIVPFVSPLFSARSAASFLPMNLFFGCFCFSCFSKQYSASTASPRSAWARSSSILARVNSRCCDFPRAVEKRPGILDLRVVTVKTPRVHKVSPQLRLTRARSHVKQLCSDSFAIVSLRYASYQAHSCARKAIGMLVCPPKLLYKHAAKSRRGTNSRGRSTRRITE